MNSTKSLLTRSSPRFFVVVSILIAFAGIGMLSASLLPYKLVQSQIAPIMLGSRSIDEFSIELYQSGVSRLRILGLVICGFALIIFLSRRYTFLYSVELISSWSAFQADMRIYIGNLLHRKNWLHLSALGLVSAVGFVLRTLYLDKPIQYDEAVTVVNYASKPLPLGLYAGYIPNNHLLHTALVRPLVLLFGFQEVAIRIPAFIMGASLIPLTYLLARKLFGAESALVAASLVSVSSLLIQYSTRSRGYTLLASLFLVSFILAIYLTEKGKNLPVAWFLFGITGTLAFFTMPIALYSYGAVALWLLIMILLVHRGQIGSSLTQMTIALGIGAVLTLLLYAPLVILSGFARLFGNEYIAPLPWNVFRVRILESLWLSFVEWHRDMPAASLWVFLGSLIISLVWGFSQRDDLRKNPLILSLIVVLWLTPIVMLQGVVPYKRVWLFLAPLYYALVAMGMWLVLDKLLALIKYERVAPSVSIGLSLILTLIFGLNVYNSNSIITSRDLGVFMGAESMAKYLHDHVAPNDAIAVVVPSTYTLDFYLEQYDMSYRQYGNYEESNQLFVVVNTGYDWSDTPEEVLDYIDVDASAYGDPRLVYSNLDGRLFVYQHDNKVR